MENNDILFNNIELLFNKNHIFEIVPTKSMNNSQKINAIIRFSLFLSILIYLFTENYLYLYIFLITLVLSYLIFLFSNKEFFKPQEKEKKNEVNSDGVSLNEEKNKKNGSNMISVECNEPTANNPLMNPLIGERKSYKKMACPNTENKIEEMIENKINESILEPSTKFFQRNFYTMPNTSTPNDQTTFAKWLYNTPVSCSEGKNSILNQRRACAYNNKTLYEL